MHLLVSFLRKNAESKKKREWDSRQPLCEPCACSEHSVALLKVSHWNPVQSSSQRALCRVICISVQGWLFFLSPVPATHRSGPQAARCLAFWNSLIPVFIMSLIAWFQWFCCQCNVGWLSLLRSSQWHSRHFAKLHCAQIFSAFQPLWSCSSTGVNQKEFFSKVVLAEFIEVSFQVLKSRYWHFQSPCFGKHLLTGAFL